MLTLTSARWSVLGAITGDVSTTSTNTMANLAASRHRHQSAYYKNYSRTGTRKHVEPGRQGQLIGTTKIKQIKLPLNTFAGINVRQSSRLLLCSILGPDHHNSIKQCPIIMHACKHTICNVQYSIALQIAICRHRNQGLPVLVHIYMTCRIGVYSILVYKVYSLMILMND